MDAAEKDEEGDDQNPPSVPNPRSPQRKRVISIQSFSSSAADIESIKKQKQEPLNCDACRIRQSSDDDLVPIAGDWRSVQLCIPCYCLLESNEICSYCFHTISSKDELFYDCIHCKRYVHFVCVAKKIAGGIAAAAEIESRDFACFDCVTPAPKPSEKGKEKEYAVLFTEEEEKGFSIHEEEEKTESRYKLRSREKAKASPITSSTEKVEPRRSLRSSGKKKAVEVPISASAVPLLNRFFSLTNCHVCGRETKKLQVLKSEWRVLLVCSTCLVSLGTDRICTYCFDPTSEKKDDYTNCQKCLRAVHFDCIRNHPVYIDRVQLNADTYTCFDCEAIPNLWKNYSVAVVPAAASIVAAAAAAGLSGELNAEEAKALNLLADAVETQPDPPPFDEQQLDSKTENQADP